MKKHKNRKKGVTLLEVAVAVATMGILFSVIGPILRYYIKLGDTYRFGIKSEGEQTGSYYKIEDIVGSMILAQLNAEKQGKRTRGIGLTTKTSKADAAETLGNLRTSILDSTANNSGSVRGNTVYMETPVYIKDKDSLGQGFHYFRFGSSGGTLKLFYNTTVDEDGMGAFISSTGSTVFTGDEEVLFPSSISSTIVTFGEFEEVTAGTVMRMKFKDTPNGKEKTIEKLFLKRGEI